MDYLVQPYIMSALLSVFVHTDHKADEIRCIKSQVEGRPPVLTAIWQIGNPMGMVKLRPLTESKPRDRLR